MPKTVEFEGKSYDFPDDASEQEIFAFLDSSSQPQEPVKPDTKTRFGAGMLTRIGENLNPMPALRAVGGALTDKRGPMTGLGDLAADAVGGILSPLQGLPDAARSIGRGEFGRAASQTMESLPIVGPSLRRAGDLERSGDTAGAFGSLAGDAVTLGLTEGAGAGLRGLAKVPARAMTGGDAAVATAALENRALPGLFRSGPSRATSRLRRAESDIKSGLRGSAGDVELRAQDIRRGAATDAEWDRIKGVRNRGALETEARELQANAVTDPASFSARDVFDRASRSRASSPTGMAAALDADQINAVGRAVPSVRTMTSRANAVQSVRDAYRGNGGQATISPAGVPTMQGKIIVSTINRAAGPLTQGLYDSGRLASSLPVRAGVASQIVSDPQREAVIELLGQPPTPEASHAPMAGPAGTSRNDLVTYGEKINQKLSDGSLPPEERAYWEEQARRTHSALQDAR